MDGRLVRHVATRLGVAAGAALLVGGAVIALQPAGAVPEFGTRLDSGTRTCTTSSTAYCTVAHGLGLEPTSVVVTAQAPILGSNIAANVDADQFTATTFRVRVFRPNGSAFVGAVTFSYVATAAELPPPTTPPASTTPPETTPPVSTTPPATTPPATTPPATTTAPAGCTSGALARACYPGDSDTGVPAGTALTTSTACDVGASGVTLDARDWNCDLTVSGSDVTITRSRIRGIIRNPGARLHLVDTTVAPNAPSVRNVAPIGQDTGDYTLTRVNMSGFQDGPRISHGTTLIEDSYVHDLAFASGEHPDALQQYCPGCVSRVTVRHSTLSGCAGADRGSSSVFWSDHPGAGSSFALRDSWLRCGQYSLRINDACSSCGVTLTMTGVVIEQGTWAFGPSECRLSAASAFTAFDVRTSSGTAVPLSDCLGS